MSEKADPPAETERPAEMRSFRSLMLGPSKSFSQSPKRMPMVANPKLTAKPSPFLKVSPRVVPRAVINPAPAIKSLLLGAPLSHCNFMTGSNRTPHKYDHFHEKTFIYDFVPSFRAGKFAHRHFELPKSPSLSPPPAPLPTTSRFIRRRPLLPSVPRNASADHTRPQLKKVLVPLAEVHTVMPVVPCRRPILCLKDGTNLGKPGVRPFFFDLQAFIDRFIGSTAKSARREVFDRSKVSLRSQAYYSLLETVSEALRPKRPFTKAFYLDGKEVEDLALVPGDCQAMLFSYKQEFRGVKGLA